jgi:hypothetical protein
MKGVVFNLLQDVVSAAHGEDVWDDLLDDAGLDGVYTSLGSYDDAELMALVAAASAKLGVPAVDVIRWFGREAIPHFAGRYPKLFAGHVETRSFVLTLNDIIHPEVRKLYPGADVPEFDFDLSDPDVMAMSYRSPRKLCSFGEGLVQGSATHFGEVAHIEQPECMLRGDARCLLQISFTR